VANEGGASFVSLPKGGGALKGRGGTFYPYIIHAGTGRFAVPIALLLKRKRTGFQPKSTLVYSTGNGPFGLGWILSVIATGSKRAAAIGSAVAARMRISQRVPVRQEVATALCRRIPVFLPQPDEVRRQP